MKLKSVKITNYRTIEDSGEFDIGDDITCLVGKNEAGKTAALNAIRGIKPYKGRGRYDKLRDYPRRHYSSYKKRHPNGEAVVCESKWDLDDADEMVLSNEFGQKFLTSRVMVVTSYYGGSSTWEISLNEKSAVAHICSQEKLDAVEKGVVANCQTTDQVHQSIEQSGNESEKLGRIKKRIGQYRDQKAYLKAIDLLSERMPSFVYFADYSRMSGEISVDQYQEDEQNEVLKDEDMLFADFLSFAGTDMDELAETDQYEEHRIQLETASNAITQQIFEYWKQNANLEIQVDVGPGKEGDPKPFNKGTVMRVRVKNRLHGASVPFSERSSGFAWFFSFLVHFSQVKEHYAGKNANVIILLDEPGLTLHAKAQLDLLRYVQKELACNHQVIYTTHSPFMIIPDRWNTIRTVEDVLIERTGSPPEIQGTKVSSDFLKTSGDTIFPLQGALGYELSQTLLIGKKVLIVEGSSDALYLKVASSILNGQGKNHIEEWTICPANGIDKIAALISLVLVHGEEREIVVLVDYQSGDRGKVQRLERNSKANVLRCSAFCEKKSANAEADVEDIFGKSVYLDLLKKSCDLDIDADAISDEGRIVKQIESLLGRKLPHNKPADWLLRNPRFLSEGTADAEQALGRFEEMFSEINGNERGRADEPKKEHTNEN
ncbi:MAG: ATP-binding protein [Gammaproteobacteria bacterium]|nr:ATP-binding protein [Gammaproteobacteria bacterium]MDA8002341.1 ATP-binding protein [Alphaproteobacteria bacterium]